MERNSAKDKIDLLAGCSGGDIYTYASPVENLLKDHFPTGNFSVCDDSVRFDLQTSTGGVALWDSALLVQEIKNWLKGKNLEGQRRSWVTGYWLPEALCGDIATSNILYDAKGIGIQIKELLLPYPQTLSRSIANLCIDEIKQKTQTLRGLLIKNSPVEFQLCVSDITASMIRLAFARSKTYLRGFRELDEQSKLLSSLDLSMYNLALQLSKGEGVEKLLDNMERFI